MLTVAIGFLALRRLRAGLRQSGRDPFVCFPGTYPSARAARLGNVPGYFQSRLAALKSISGTVHSLFGLRVISGIRRRITAK